MKLLFDQNISFRIINKIITTFPDSKQVRELKLENFSDKQIWDYAKKNQFIIITFDVDFSNLNALYGFPPKIIWIRTGNITTNNIKNLLHNNYGIINEFATNKDLGCLELTL